MLFLHFWGFLKVIKMESKKMFYHIITTVKNVTQYIWFQVFDMLSILCSILICMEFISIWVHQAHTTCIWIDIWFWCFSNFLKFPKTNLRLEGQLVCLLAADTCLFQFLQNIGKILLGDHDIICWWKGKYNLRNMIEHFFDARTCYFCIFEVF